MGNKLSMSRDSQADQLKKLRKSGPKACNVLFPKCCRKNRRIPSTLCKKKKFTWQPRPNNMPFAELKTEIERRAIGATHRLHNGPQKLNDQIFNVKGSVNYHLTKEKAQLTN